MKHSSAPMRPQNRRRRPAGFAARYLHLYSGRRQSKLWSIMMRDLSLKHVSAPTPIVVDPASIRKPRRPTREPLRRQDDFRVRLRPCPTQAQWQQVPLTHGRWPGQSSPVCRSPSRESPRRQGRHHCGWAHRWKWDERCV